MLRTTSEPSSTALMICLTSCNLPAFQRSVAPDILKFWLVSHWLASARQNSLSELAARVVLFAVQLVATGIKSQGHCRKEQKDAAICLGNMSCSKTQSGEGPLAKASSSLGNHDDAFATQRVTSRILIALIPGLVVNRSASRS